MCKPWWRAVPGCVPKIWWLEQRVSNAGGASSVPVSLHVFLPLAGRAFLPSAARGFLLPALPLPPGHAVRCDVMRGRARGASRGGAKESMARPRRVRFDARRLRPLTAGGPVRARARRRAAPAAPGGAATARGAAVGRE